MSSSVRLAMPSPLFIFLDSRVFNAARCCSEKSSTRQGNCSIRWEHHGLAYGLPDVTEPAFHLELQLLLGFSEKRYHLPHFCQKLWPPVHLQGFFSRPDLVCVCVIHPTRESISAPPPARIMFFCLICDQCWVLVFDVPRPAAKLCPSSGDERERFLIKIRNTSLSLPKSALHWTVAAGERISVLLMFMSQLHYPVSWVQYYGAKVASPGNGRDFTVY